MQTEMNNTENIIDRLDQNFEEPNLEITSLVEKYDIKDKPEIKVNSRA